MDFFLSKLNQIRDVVQTNIRTMVQVYHQVVEKTTEYVQNIIRPRFHLLVQFSLAMFVRVTNQVKETVSEYYKIFVSHSLIWKDRCEIWMWVCFHVLYGLYLLCLDKYKTWLWGPVCKGKHQYEVLFYFDTKWYRIPFSVPRGPKPLCYSFDSDGKDISNRIKEYAGPALNFFDLTMTPSMLGHSSLSINGTTFQSNDKLHV
jgi:hypothetical protein